MYKRQVQDPAVFEGLAAFFDVDTAFLMGQDGAATPEKVAAQLDLVRSMRAAKVKSYAARTLGAVSYTHLDVYKRQAPTCPGRAGRT